MKILLNTRKVSEINLRFREPTILELEIKEVAEMVSVDGGPPVDRATIKLADCDKS